MPANALQVGRPRLEQPLKARVSEDSVRAAVDVVAEVIERIGYDPVRLDSLRAGRILQPGGPVFGVPLRCTEFQLAMRAEAA